MFPFSTFEHGHFCTHSTTSITYSILAMSMSQHLLGIAPYLLSTTAQFTENPFASTHSLDTNPFDDPSPYSASAASSKVTVDATRLQELEQRERDLERREQELTQKADYIRKHGRNNWPPCLSHFARCAAAVHADPLPQSIPSYSILSQRKYQKAQDRLLPSSTSFGSYSLLRWSST